MKLLMIAVFLMMFSGVAQAVGTYDGIYSCNFTYSRGTIATYITVNGTPSGLIILTFPNLTSSTYYYGYAYGTMTGNTLSGMTNYGYSATGTVSGVAGSYVLRGNTTIVSNGFAIPATVDCSQVL